MPPSAERVLRLVEAGRPRVAIFSEQRDWHARRIARHLTAMGAEPRLVHLAKCQFTSAAPSGIAIPGFRRNLPDACIVRSVPGRSFEAVTRRLGILHALRELGVVVWNDARVIERCVDKSTTTFYAAGGNCRAEDLDRGEQGQSRCHRKPRTAPRPARGEAAVRLAGTGLRLVASLEELPEPEEVDGVYYLQRFMGVEGDKGFHDFRIFVVNGTPVAGMTGAVQAGSPMSSRAAGRSPWGEDRQLEELSVRAAKAVAADFCGVDLLRGANGETVVLEVNSMPAWSGLQKVSTVDIAEVLAREVLGALEGRRGLRNDDPPRPDRQGLYRCLRCRARCTEARQCPCVRRRPRHGGGAFPCCCPSLGQSVDRAETAGRDEIFNAVEASMKVALTNTNLGIVLLCAPLAAAAEQQGRKFRTLCAACSTASTGRMPPMPFVPLS